MNHSSTRYLYRGHADALSNRRISAYLVTRLGRGKVVARIEPLGQLDPVSFEHDLTVARLERRLVGVGPWEVRGPSLVRMGVRELRAR